MSFERRLRLSVFALTAIIAAGCGNTIKSPSSQKVAAASSQGAGFSWDTSGSVPSGSGSGSASGEYLCPSGPNVKPDYRWGNPEDGLYTACPSQNSVNRIRVMGKPRTSGQRICVFPSQVIDSTDPSQSPRVLSKPGLDGLPMMSCGYPGTVGLDLEFRNTVFNAVFVVDEDAAQDMRTCLFTSQSWQCPRDWSFGRFRTQ